jgi:serine/threonine protein kinase
MSVWRLRGFEELHELGSGAQGRVVLARRAGTGEMVAIKYLAPDLLGDPRHKAMFRDEVNMLVRVADPHVARLYEYVETPEGAAIVMEAVNGVSLRDVLSRNPPLSPEAALTVLKGSLQGLAAAHAVHVVHRDYKPANVLVESSGNSKLVDFGIAGLAGEGTFAGTPAYMAPEQWDGAPASPAADVYSATCVFFECVTGRPPYTERDTTTLRHRHQAAPVPAYAVPEPLRPLVAHGMAKSPVRRPPDARQFVGLLEQVATEAYGPDWERRGWIALGTAAAVIAAGLPAAALGMTSGATGLAHGVGHLAGKVGAKGLFGKVTGLKVGGGLVATAVAATTVYLVWPTPEHVGGVSSGSVRMYLAQPAAIFPYRDTTAADSPVFDFNFTVTPSRIRPGVTLRVTDRVVTENPGGPAKRATSPRCYDREIARSQRDATYTYSFLVVPGNQQAKNNYVSFFPAPKEKITRLPTTRSIDLTAGHVKEVQRDSHYDAGRCVLVEHLSTALTFTVPRDARLDQGDYFFSPIGPPRITAINAGIGKKPAPVDPRSVGARSEGTLPRITILG